MFLDVCEMGDDGGSNCDYGANETDMNHHCSKGLGCHGDVIYIKNVKMINLSNKHTTLYNHCYLLGPAVS